MNNNDASRMLPYPVPTMPRTLRIVSTGEVVIFMGINHSEFVDPKQKVRVQNSKKEIFEVLLRDTTAATDKEMLDFCKIFPECDWLPLP
ncbi:MAG TPA: hypothetical protein VKV04_24605 [Verrucomicrobiae bacterium]|nr:hypothetical protein [Verrucomicrobiae bacterium]